MSPGIESDGNCSVQTCPMLYNFFSVSQSFSPLRVEVDDQGMAVKAGFARGLPDLCHCSVTVLMMFDGAVEVNGYAVHSHSD